MFVIGSSTGNAVRISPRPYTVGYVVASLTETVSLMRIFRTLTSNAVIALSGPFIRIFGSERMNNLMTRRT